jgi:putative membrane protein
MMTGILGTAMWLMMGLMLVAVASSAVAWTLRRLRRRPTDPPLDEPLHEPPKEILRRRYAAGEIDRDEYLRRRHDLNEH